MKRIQRRTMRRIRKHHYKKIMSFLQALRLYAQDAGGRVRVWRCYEKPLS